MSDFSRIAVGIKTFLRDTHLFNAVKGIQKNMPNALMIIVDDGYTTPLFSMKRSAYENLSHNGHLIHILPFDSGFGAKSNLMAAIFLEDSSRDYLLIGSDDFDFTAEAAEGVLKLQEVLDNVPDVHIASGRVWNRPYEFYLEEKDGVISEIPVQPAPGGVLPWYYEVDLTVNYSLIRRDVLKVVKWDDDAKIGQGEHGAWFLDVKHAGFKVAFVPGVNINEQKIRPSEEYRKFRARANSPQRSCFKRRGIKRYILGNGQVDYDAVS